MFSFRLKWLFLYFMHITFVPSYLSESKHFEYSDVWLIHYDLHQNITEFFLCCRSVKSEIRSVYSLKRMLHFKIINTAHKLSIALAENAKSWSVCTDVVLWWVFLSFWPKMFITAWMWTKILESLMPSCVQCITIDATLLYIHIPDYTVTCKEQTTEFHILLLVLIVQICTIQEWYILYFGVA